MNTVENLMKLLKDWEHFTIEFLPRLFLALVVLLIFFFLARFGKKISRRLYSKSNRANADVVKIIGAVVHFFLLLFGVFIALEILGLEQVLTKLLAGAGVIGIVAGFAFKDIASNAFAGLLLSIQRPIKVGDWVEMEDAYGIVTKISWLTTALENTTGQEVFVPNQMIYNNTFTNFTTFNKRRIVLRSGVSLTSDLEHVKSLAIDEIKKSKNILDNEDVNFFYTNIGDSTFDFEISFWIRFNTEMAYQQAMSDAIVKIKNRFEMEKIQLS